jgi:hypothetical protein
MKSNLTQTKKRKAASGKKLGRKPISDCPNRVIGTKLPVDIRDDFLSMSKQLNLTHSILLRMLIKDFVDKNKKMINSS